MFKVIKFIVTPEVIISSTHSYYLSTHSYFRHNCADLNLFCKSIYDQFNNPTLLSQQMKNFIQISISPNKVNRLV